MDKLAKEGIQCLNHFAQGTRTSQSVPADFSGNYVPSCFPMVERNGRRGEERRTTFHYVPFDMNSFVERFEEAGYYTLMCAHLPPVYQFSLDADPKDFVNRRGFAEVIESDLRYPDLMLREAFDGLDGREEPFFAYLHITRPHIPYDPRIPFDLWSNPFYEGFWKQREAETGADMATCAIDPAEVKTPEDLQYLLAKYDGCIRDADDSVGLVREYAATRTRRDTILVVKADHGEMFQEHGDEPGQRGKQIQHLGGMGNELVKTPCLMQVPNVKARRIYAPTANIDVGPTLLELAGLDGEFGQGTSLVRAMTGAYNLQDRRVFSSTPYEPKQGGTRIFTKLQPAHCVVGIVNGTLYKFIMSENADEELDGEERHELYDLVSDPTEMINLRDFERGVAEMLRGELATWFSRQKTIARGKLLTEVQQREIDPEVEQRLRALGYVR